MLKDKYLVWALQNKAHHKDGWLLEVFAIVESTKEDAYIGQLVRDEDGIKTVVNIEPLEYEAIEDYEGDGPLFHFEDELKVKEGDFYILDENIVTRAGVLVVNILALNDILGRKIPYMNGFFDMYRVNAEMENRLVDTPIVNGDYYTIEEAIKDNMKKSSVKDPITVVEKLEYDMAIQSLEKYVNVLTYSDTPRNVQSAPGISEYRDKLFEEYGEKAYTDPLVGVIIENKLRDYDTAY